MSCDNFNALCAALSGALSVDIDHILIDNVNISGGCGGTIGGDADDDFVDNGDDNGGDDNGDGGGGFKPPIIQFPTIRNNYWEIRPDKGIAQVCYFDFTVKEVQVTEKQPCEVYAGTTYRSKDNQILFNFGRKPSADVERWWWKTLGSSAAYTCNTIWSDEDYTTNFAALGDLTVYYRKVAGGEILSHTMPDVVVSQWNDYLGTVHQWNLGSVNWTRDRTDTCDIASSTYSRQLNENGTNFTMNGRGDNIFLFGERG
jgi:hypothetical protein